MPDWIKEMEEKLGSGRSIFDELRWVVRDTVPNPAVCTVLLEKIDQLGGMRTAIELGYVQGEIQNSAYAYQLAVEEGERVVVGVNRFTTDQEQTLDMLRVDPAVSDQQKARLAQVRQERDAERVRQTLGALHAAAQADANLMPYLTDCVQAYATLGEMCDILRDVFGEYRPECVF